MWTPSTRQRRLDAELDRESVVGGLAPAPSAQGHAAEGRAERGAGRAVRRFVPTERAYRGHSSGARPAGAPPIDVEWAATLRATAHLQPMRRAAEDAVQLAIRLHLDELLRRRRFHRPPQRLVLLVDVSGSMGHATLATAKSICRELLRQAYIRREQVAMVAFRERSAEPIFEFTDQAERVQEALAALPCGGTTPLAAGLRRAHALIRTARRRQAEGRVRLVVVSDGRANVGARPGHAAVLAEVEAEARALATEPGLSILLLDTTPRGKTEGAVRRLAHQLAATRLRVDASA